jgi:hypothetical protein
VRLALRLRLRALKLVLGIWLDRMPSSQRLVLLAGLVLIVVGIFCLCLSGVVVTGWWQGTLDAFGVGFVVGGIVDVLAISGLNQVSADEEHERQENNRLAQEIIQSYQGDPAQARQAAELLARSRSLIDPVLAGALLSIVGWGGAAEDPGTDVRQE